LTFGADFGDAIDVVTDLGTTILDQVFADLV
jgi:hypothetical protein